MPNPGSPQPGRTPGPARSRWAVVPHRVMLRLDDLLQRRGVQASAVLLLATLLALVLGPSFVRSDSELSRLRVGMRAPENLKASCSFNYYPSEQELERQRNEAAAKELPVFDYQSDLGATVVSRINRAFETAAVEEARARHVRGRYGATAGKSLSEAERRELFAGLLQTSLSAEQFRAFRGANFSPEVQATVSMLVGSALDRYVVAHRGVIQPFVEGAISVRTFVVEGTEPRGERTLGNFDKVYDLERTRAMIERQASIHAAKFPTDLRRAIVDLATSLVGPNLVFNPVETRRREQAARRAVVSRPVPYIEGQVIVLDGEPITADHLRVFATMQEKEHAATGPILIGVGLFALLMVVSIHHVAARQFRRFVRRPRDLVVMGLLFFAMLASTRGAIALGGGPDEHIHAQFYPYLIPVAAGAMLVRLLITAEAASLFAVAVAALAGLLLDRDLSLALYYLIAGLVGSYGVRQVHSRSTVLRAGLISGLLGAATVFCLRLVGWSAAVQETLAYSMLAAIGGGLLSAFTTLALLPVLEWFFAYTTEVTLLELANLNHPLMRELMLRAPGTYHHSMIVGGLAEAACEAIGANGLLARVAANYHDVGKMKNPSYFAENMRPGDNPHNRLKPSMSGLIIRNHVKDGVELMLQHGVPQLVVDTASQHHGTALIAYFYHKALEQKDPDDEVHEEDYRYPGPQPQSREAGVLMLADGIEAAARSLAEPTADRLQALVQRIINTQFTDGQLDHCDLTLRDLHRIAKSFMQVLGGIYHARPAYPWQRGEDSRRPDDRRKEKDAAAPRVTGAERARSNAPAGDPARAPGTSEEKSKHAKAGGDRADSEEKSPVAAGPESQDGPAPDGSTDLKRLGLN